MTASIEIARQAEAPGALISRGPGQPQQPRPASRRRDAILIVIMLAAAANLALQQGAIFAIVLAATSGRRLDFIYGRIRQWIGFGPSECPFVRSRRSHRPFPLRLTTSSHPCAVQAAGGGTRPPGYTCRIRCVTTQGRALRACGPELGDMNAVHHGRPTVVAGVNIRSGLRAQVRSLRSVAALGMRARGELYTREMRVRGFSVAVRYRWTGGSPPVVSRCSRARDSCPAPHGCRLGPGRDLTRGMNSPAGWVRPAHLHLPGPHQCTSSRLVSAGDATYRIAELLRCRRPQRRNAQTTRENEISRKSSISP